MITSDDAANRAQNLVRFSHGIAGMLYLAAIVIFLIGAVLYPSANLPSAAQWFIIAGTAAVAGSLALVAAGLAAIARSISAGKSESGTA